MQLLNTMGKKKSNYVYDSEDITDTKARRGLEIANKELERLVTQFPTICGLPLRKHPWV